MERVETSGGTVRGVRNGNICVFKGIPYAVAQRFRAAQPASWAGVHDAIEYGPRCPQIEPPGDAPWIAWWRDKTPTREDCLTLNVFTTGLTDRERRPVMVYLHGGGFAFGSGGAPGLDGSNLAGAGVVLVSINHRLNLFGHLHLGDGFPDEFRQSGNAGLLDIVTALEWVRDNIAHFGGDPANVTIFGQSGGGSKVAALMASPRAKGLFHKAIVQSASSLLSMATLVEAERNTDFFLRELSIERTRFRELDDIPAAALLAAMRRSTANAGHVDNFRPLVDGEFLPHQPFSAGALAISADVPLLIGWCENEQRLKFSGDPSLFEQPRHKALAGICAAVGVGVERADALLRLYEQSRPTDSPGDLHAQVFGDHRYRRNITAAADVHAHFARAPAFMYLMRWKSPVLGGLLRTPHTLCLPFAFGNVDLASGITGTGEDRYELQRQMVHAWTSFARAGKAPWPRYEGTRRRTMVFDLESGVVDDPLREERIALLDCPAYDPAAAEARLRQPPATGYSGK